MFKLRRLVVTAFMSALAVILTRFVSLRIAVMGVESSRLGVGGLPSVLAGIALGPAYGFMAGALADVAGFFLSPLGGGYMPHFTLTAGLFGAIPGLVLGLMEKRSNPGEKDFSWAKLAFSLVVATVFISLGLTPYFLHTLFGMPYAALIPTRLLTAAVEVPSYAVILRVVLVPLKRGGFLRD